MSRRQKYDPETGERMYDPETGERLYEDDVEPPAPKEGLVKRAFKTVLPATTAYVTTPGSTHNAAGEPTPAWAPLAADVMGGGFRLAGSLIPTRFTRGTVKDEAGQDRMRTMPEALQNPGADMATGVHEAMQEKLPAPVAAAGSIALGVAQGGLVSGPIGAARYMKTPRAQRMAMAEHSRTVKAAAKISSALNKVSPEALLKASTKEGREALAGAASARGQIGNALEDLVKQTGKGLPEEAEVHTLVEQMGGVSPKSIIDALDKARPARQRVQTGTGLKGRARTQNQAGTYTEEVPLSEGEVLVGKMGDGSSVSTGGRGVAEAGGNLPATQAAQPGGTKYQTTAEVQVPYSRPVVSGYKPGGGLPPEIGSTSAVDAANDQIDGLIGRIKAMAGEDPHTGQAGKLSGENLRVIRQQYDDLAKSSFEKDWSNYVETALKAGRTAMAEEMVGAAKRANVGKPYIAVMERYAQKLEALDDLKAKMGWDERSRSFNKDRVHQNLFGPDKRTTREVIATLDKLFGKDFIERAKLEDLALEFGPDGKPAFLPNEGSARAAILALGAGGHYAGRAMGLPDGVGALPAVGIGAMASPQVAAQVGIPAVRAARGSMKLSPTAPLYMGLAGSLAPQEK